MEHCMSCPFYLKSLQSCPINIEYLSLDHPFEMLIEYFFVMLSVLPYILGFIICLKALATFTARSSCLFILLVGQNAFGELLKHVIGESRPEDACSKSYGFPSSHSVMISGLSFWLILENLFYSSRACFKHAKHRKLYNYLTWISAPFVMYSRIYLHYHTWSQVLGGMLLGYLCAGVLFAFVKINVLMLENSNFMGDLPIAYVAWNFLNIKIDMHKEIFWVRQIKAMKDTSQVEKFVELEKTYQEVHKLKQSLEKQKDFLTEKVKKIQNDLGPINNLNSAEILKQKSSNGKAK